MLLKDHVQSGSILLDVPDLVLYGDCTTAIGEPWPGYKQVMVRI